MRPLRVRQLYHAPDGHPKSVCQQGSVAKYVGERSRAILARSGTASVGTAAACRGCC